MAKVTKKVLKEIVKQCLVEILVEGLNSEEEEDTLFESLIPTKSIPPRSKRSVLKESQKKPRPPRKIISEDAIKNVAAGDNVMEDIFADTAATTLAQQGMTNENKRGSYVPADGAARVVQENNLEDLFDGTNNWATLAFSAGKPKN